MAGAPRVRSMNMADPEARPVLGPAGNKAKSPAKKPASNLSRKAEEGEEKKSRSMSFPSAYRFLSWSSGRGRGRVLG